MSSSRHTIIPDIAGRVIVSDTALERAKKIRQLAHEKRKQRKENG